jgi:carbamoyl-phosphate synthase large subunit
MAPHQVLILSAGRRVSLVRAFQEAMRRLALPGRILTADLRPELSAACQIAERRQLPHVLSDEYPQALARLCREEGIALAVPTIDTELAVLSSLREEFAAQGTHLMVSSADLVRRCRDKRLTVGLFEGLGLPTPRLYRGGDLQFPLFAKPISGSMSQGIRVFTSARELEHSELDLQAHLLMEVVSAQDWEECTLDIYYDRNGTLRCLVPRRRTEVRCGEISKGWTDKSLLPLLKPAFEKVLGARGCLTAQVFAHRHSESVLGIEINPRFGGGFPLSERAGARYPEWLLREYLLGQTLEYRDDWEDRLMMLRYDAEVWTRYQDPLQP